MKKLKLNKQVIASLDNPNRIFGGEEGGRVSDGVTCGDTCVTKCNTCDNGATCAGGATCDGQTTCPRPNQLCFVTIECQITMPLTTTC